MNGGPIRRLIGVHTRLLWPSSVSLGHCQKCPVFNQSNEAVIRVLSAELIGQVMATQLYIIMMIWFYINAVFR